jgi:hypothetical protein
MEATTFTNTGPTYEELEAELADVRKQLAYRTAAVQDLARQNDALEEIVRGFARHYLEMQA